jgi:hypothetical protein
VEMMLTDWVIVTAPNPPGSSTLISPPGVVFEIAPAKVLQGAVRLQGFASSPTPDTHVRVACACTGVAWSAAKSTPIAANQKMNVRTTFSPSVFLGYG